MAHYTLGMNLGFAINRFPEPPEWARIVAEDLGLRSVQLVADLLNPFWPEPVVEAEVARISEATARYGLRISSLMTSSLTRVGHFLHPYPEHRQAWFEWFQRLADLAARLGARAVGSHFGILSVRDVQDPARYRERVAEGVCRWRALSHYARDIGLDYVYFETMSTPREMAWTIAQARELYERANEGAGVPVRLCLDVGHAPHPEERDPYRWLRELGRYAEIVHLQQTEPNHSRHWPFTPDYNALGIVEPAQVLEALSEGGAGDLDLAFEIAHREVWEQEPRVLDDLKASVEYWRPFLR